MESIFNAVRNSLSVFLLIGVVSCSSVKSFYNPVAPILSPWSGQYRHISGKFELRLQQFAEDSLAADIIALPESNPQHVFASFFAEIKNDVATSRDRTDPDCRLELRLLKEGVEFSDFCHPVGHGDIGLYRSVK